MRVMIDTNIFISAVLFPDGKASASLKKALSSPYQPVTCDYVIDELRRKFVEKYPDRVIVQTDMKIQFMATTRR